MKAIPAIQNLELNHSDRAQQSQVPLLAATNLFVAQGGKSRRVGRRVVVNVAANVVGSTLDLPPELRARSGAKTLWEQEAVGRPRGWKQDVLIWICVSSTLLFIGISNFKKTFKQHLNPLQFTTNRQLLKDAPPANWRQKSAPLTSRWPVRATLRCDNRSNEC